MPTLPGANPNFYCGRGTRKPAPRRGVYNGIMASEIKAGEGLEYDWLTSRREKTIVIGLLVATFALAAGSAAQKSVTVDEYQALPHGLAIWKTGDFHLATAVPVLPSVLPAIPALAAGAPLDTAAMPQYTSSWQCGLQFVVENAFDRDLQSGQYLPSGRYHDYFLLGRLVSIAALLLTCGLVYGFARSLYGREAGLLALAVACFSPNLLAHGRLVTPDIYLAAASIGSLWAYDCLVRRPSWSRTTLLGVCLGLAALCKLTGLLSFALFPLCSLFVWLVDFCRERPLWGSARNKATPLRGSRNATEGAPYRQSRNAADGDRYQASNEGVDRELPDECKQQRWPFLLASLAIGLLVVNAAYLFDGCFTPLGRFTFESWQAQKFVEWLPQWLPVPLPRFFFQGIDAQLAESGYTAYLMGEFNTEGFYSYYLIALLIKTPAPVLLLCGLACFCRGWPTRREVPLVIVAILLLLFFSLSRHKNIGVRYVLFLEPMMAVWIGRILCGARVPPARNKQAGRLHHLSSLPTWLRRTVLAATTALAAIALLSWPHYLPYFNWLSGGPNNGHRWLLDSNLDWGQDLIALRRYMEQQQIEEIDLAHFGRVPPEVYGIRYRALRAGEKPQHRFVAISANLLWGLMYIVDGDLNYWPDDPDSYSAFRSLRPSAILGHSIYVYDLGHVASGNGWLSLHSGLE
jgi:hypothetical protein